MNAHTNSARSPHVAAILFACIFAGQSGQLALTPVLTKAAGSFGISTAAAGQIRTAAAAVAALAALAVGSVAARVGLRTLLRAGVALTAAGAVLSFVAPSAPVLTAAQALTGAAASVIVASGVAAAAAWSNGDRGRVVARTLVGAPAAWIVAMPLIGAVATTSWRLAFAVPAAAAVVAAVALRRAPAGSPQAPRGGLRAVLAERALRRWALGEALAYAAWGGVLVYAGALFLESYGVSVAAVGLALGLGAAAYIPGTFAAQRVGPARARALLAATGLVLAPFTLGFGLLRSGPMLSAVAFGALCFLAGARTYFGSAVGLDLAGGLQAAAMSVRAAAQQAGWLVGGAAGGAALSLGGYPALGVTLGVFFAAAALPHVRALGSLTPQLRTRAIRPARLPLEAAPAPCR